jgi:dephospho-CoA kinase
MSMLITGISGTGKSTVTQELAKLGFLAVDADCDRYSKWADAPNTPDLGSSPVLPGRDWVWREDKIRELLQGTKQANLILSGCAANMGPFVPMFEHVVLLSCPAAVMIRRLATRTGNDYGKQPHELERILALKESIEPRLRKLSTLELDTAQPLAETISRLSCLCAGDVSH